MYVDQVANNGVLSKTSGSSTSLPTKKALRKWIDCNQTRKRTNAFKTPAPPEAKRQASSKSKLQSQKKGTRQKLNTSQQRQQRKRKRLVIESSSEDIDESDLDDESMKMKLKGWFRSSRTSWCPRSHKSWVSF